MTITPQDRTRLDRAIGAARLIIESDLHRRAEGEFGLVTPEEVQPEEALALSPAALGTRRQLVEVVEHLRQSDGDEAGPVGRLLREASFTLLNRLVAVRVAEASGLLAPALSDGPRSRGFQDLLELFPLLRDEPTGGYWTFLRLCADELARDAPVLFDPRNPLLGLEPSAQALTDVVDVLSDPALKGIWSAPDTFGWTYQFFNRPEERLAMREASSAPRSSRELAVRNQFFTPRYVVDFLVHNTLGRRLVEGGFGQELAERLELLIPDGGPREQLLDLDDVRVLDPAVGSGHFLLGCYDVLQAAWELGGVSAQEAAPRIVRALWGIDIDPRCAQVAAAAIALHARRRRRDGDLPRPNVFTARALPDDPDAWREALADLDQHDRALVRRIQEVLTDAPILGPLLKVEEALHREIRAADPTADPDKTRLFAGVAADAFGRAEATILAAIREVASKASATPAERLLAAEAADAMGFVDAMRQRYDAVLMNPPFGEPVPASKSYLRGAYSALPSNADLLAAFVMRGLDLCREGGSVGAITSRSGLFLSTFEKWRREVLLEQDLLVLADLGQGVMEQAMVEAAAYVVRPSSQSQRPTRFIRLLDAADRESSLARSISEERAGGANSRLYRVDSTSLLTLPGAPLAYWIPSSLRDLFARHPRLDGSAADVRRGSWPGDDFRHLRLWWEVTGHPDWVPYAKGGEYAPFYAEPVLVVGWDPDRRTFRDFYGRPGRPTHLPENVDYFFRPGLTWSRRTQAGFNVRVLPTGCAFADKGPAVFPRSDTDPFALLGWLISRPFTALLDSLVSFGSYEVGAVQRMPWPATQMSEGDVRELGRLVEKVTYACAHARTSDETSRRFVCPPVLGEGGGSLRQRTLEVIRRQLLNAADALDRLAEAEAIIRGSLQLDETASGFLNKAHGRLPANAPKRPLTAEDLALLEERRDNGSLELGAGSYFVNPILEGASRVLDCHPYSIAEAEEAASALSALELKHAAETLISYFVGCALGRWDIRVAQTCHQDLPQFDLFDSLPPRPPGMLLSGNGRATADAPPDYPLALPPDRILLDEPGHQWDIEAAVRRTAALVFEDPDDILEEVEGLLGSRSLGDYLRRQFFRDHLRQYSKSRRKAPIYWQLAVPSRTWSTWIYAPTFSRETLYAVAREGNRRRHLAVEWIARLRTDSGEASRRDRARVDRERQAAEQLVEELSAFKVEVERVAGLGWEADLEDGALLCAAPLADLFPAWPEAKRAREALQKGEYPWARVAQWAEVLT